MVRVYGLTAVALTLAAGVLMTRAKALDKPAVIKVGGLPTVKIGMPQAMFRDVSPAQVRAASIPFKGVFREQTGMESDIDTCADYETLASRLNDSEYGLAVFHGFEYAWVRKQYPDLRPLAVTIPQGRQVRACLLVHKDATATAPKDLSGECVGLPRGLKAHCHLYLERLRGDLAADACRPAKHPAMTPEEVLDAVVNGPLKAGLVDVSSLLAYQNLKPGAFSQLRVLAESESFPAAVVAYRDGSLDAPTANKVRAGLVRANSTAQGRLLCTFWNLKGFEDVPANYDAQLQSILKAYPAPPAGSGVVPSGGLPPR